MQALLDNMAMSTPNWVSRWMIGVGFAGFAVAVLRGYAFRIGRWVSFLTGRELEPDERRALSRRRLVQSFLPAAVFFVMTMLGFRLATTSGPGAF